MKNATPEITADAARLLREAMESRASDKVAELAACLSELAADERADKIESLVDDDLNVSWQRGVPRCRIEDYMQLLRSDFPSLADGEVLANLAETELKARCRWPKPNDRPSLDDYRRRFPDQSKIVDHLQQVCYDDGRYIRYGSQREGGMGRVWPARDLHLQRLVALKEPLPERAAEADVLSRLAKEAALTARLDHPSIVTVHEMDRGDVRGPYYIMRWVEGDEMQDRIDRLHKPKSPLTDQQRRALTKELFQALSAVCDAVAYAHDQDVIHRDLKPKNIVMGKYGETTLLDWGLAKSIDGVEIVVQQPRRQAATDVVDRTTETPRAGGLDPTVLKTTFVGTPQYMAPEQVEGNVSHRSDVFALGGILYHIVTGRPPRDVEIGDDRLRLAERIKNDPIVAAREIKRDVLRTLDAVCMKAMAHDPQERYATARELGEEIERHLSDEPVLAYRESRWERLQRRLRRRVKFTTAFLVAAVIVALVATAGTAVSGWQWFRAESATESALENLESTKRERNRVERVLASSLIVVDSFLDVVSNKMNRAPGIENHRRRMLEEGLAFKEYLISERGSDKGAATPATANVHFAIANISSQLGQFTKARKAYQTAISQIESLLSADPENPSHHSQLAAMLNNYSNLLRDTGDMRRALEIVKRSGREFDWLRKRFPNAPRHVRNYAGYLTSLGTIYDRLRERVAAKEAFQQALKILKEYLAKHPQDSDAPGMLAGAQMSLANLLDDEGRLEEALKFHRLAVAGSRKLFKDNSTIRERAISLADAFNNMAVTLRHLNQLDESVLTYRQMISIRSRIHKLHPHIPDFANSLAAGHFNLGNVLNAQGKRKEAREQFEIAVALRREIREDFAENPTFQRTYAQTLINLAQTYGGAGEITDITQAAKSFREARAVLERLRANRPGDSDVTLDLAFYHRRYGVFLHEQKKYRDAIRAFEEAVKLCKPLTMRAPDDLEFAKELAFAYGNWGIALEQRKLLKEALEKIGKAAEIFETLARRAPQAKDVRDYFLTSTVGQIIFLRRLDRIRQAIAVAKRFREILPLYGSGLYVVASQLAACLPKTGNGKQKLTAEQQALHDEVVPECLRLLRQAVAGGFRNANSLRLNPNLKPLRSLPEFQRILDSLRPAANDRPAVAPRPKSQPAVD